MEEKEKSTPQSEGTMDENSSLDASGSVSNTDKTEKRIEKKIEPKKEEAKEKESEKDSDEPERLTKFQMFFFFIVVLFTAFLLYLKFIWEKRNDKTGDQEIEHPIDNQDDISRDLDDFNPEDYSMGNRFPEQFDPMEDLEDDYSRYPMPPDETVGPQAPE